MFEALEDRADANALVRLHRSFGPLTVEVHIRDTAAGEVRELVRIDEAGVLVGQASGGAEPDIVLAATESAWSEMMKPVPAPGYQTLSAMRRTRALSVERGILKYAQHLLLLEMLFVLLKEPVAATDAAPRPVGDPYVEEVNGRYLHLDFEGRPHRVYFETAGEGIPLICLHTAGSDSRQFRGILNDREITSRFRVIAFDLPWHGKSSPPPGWESDVYELTTDRYVGTVMAFKRALKLDRPVVMGCSIGGRAVLHLALRHADEFRAAIGLQSALYAENRPIGEPDPRMHLNRPDIHGGHLAGAMMSGLVSPTSPPHERWETVWHYMQGGPGVFHGDLVYYFDDGDLRNGGAAAIGQSRCPVYLLSGEYDFSATPEMGRQLAEQIGARHFQVMKCLGHFPMSESPEQFRRYLMPVLEAIERL